MSGISRLVQAGVGRKVCHEPSADLLSRWIVLRPHTHNSSQLTSVSFVALWTELICMLRLSFSLSHTHLSASSPAHDVEERWRDIAGPVAYSQKLVLQQRCEFLHGEMSDEWVITAASFITAFIYCAAQSWSLTFAPDTVSWWLDE